MNCDGCQPPVAVTRVWQRSACRYPAPEPDLGLTFEIRQLTELEDDSALEVGPFTLENLGSGDFVEVVGFLDGDRLVAAEIERLDVDASRASRLRAPAEEPAVINAEGDVEVSLLGVSVGSTSTTCSGSDREPAVGRPAER